MTEWFEEDGFWEAFSPFLFSDARVGASEEEVEKILALTGFGGRDVLDLCCGPGRHAVLLAARGYAVTGVDRTASLLDEARARAAEVGAEVEWVNEDIRTFVRPGSFDLAINLFTSFGYFDDQEEDVRVLRNVHSSLRDGGMLVIETLGKESVARNVQPTTSETLPDGSLVVQRSEIFDDWTRKRNEWVIVKDGKVTRRTFHFTLYSAQELKQRLRDVGFGEVRVYGNLAGDPYDLSAQELIVVATK